MCDLVLSPSGKVFPLVLTPTRQRTSTKLDVYFRFQSEKETGDRNYAIGYYLKEKKVPGRGWGESWESCSWWPGSWGWGQAEVLAV